MQDNTEINETVVSVYEYVTRMIRWYQCTTCNGTGGRAINERVSVECDSCNGHGVNELSEKIGSYQIMLYLKRRGYIYE